MPTLNWMGKDKIVNYDSTVPVHVLNHSYNFGGESENKIIHGDNLLALKSLLPVYESKIKCIYIDPPYNTGNEGWIYNDNVNSPQIQKWLGQVVGREGEDFSRHDKWLCMMYPRLKILKQLLSDDGAIFISIDDNEVASLKFICDEIFGRQNFLAQFNWRRRTGANDAANNISVDHEYIICYRKSDRVILNGVTKTFENYSNPDNDPRGDWAKDNLTCGKTATQRPNLFYPITDPKTGIVYECNPNRVWSFEKDKMKTLIETGKVIFPPNGKGRPAYKRHKSEVRSDTKPFSTIIDTQLNTVATRELREIFGEQVFDYPKTVNLIEQIISQSTDKNSIVLDAFAGSGTTAHAVINLNATDGGQRKFILIEMENYAENITAERVRRIGGNFDYYEVGEPIFIDGELNENIPLEKIREYVWQIDTRTKYIKPADDCEEFLGIDEGTAYYYYEGILDRNFLGKIKTRADSYVIYAETCAIDEEFLQRYKIEFRKIPRDILKI